MTPERHLSPAAASRFVAAIAAVLVAIAACASGAATPAPSQASASSSPSTDISLPPGAATLIPPPLPSIYPVPTSQAQAPAAAPAAKLDDAAATALQKSIDAYRSKFRIPGLSAAVVFPDGSVWSGQSGVSVVAGAKVNGDTLFAVGSISKTFTGALALSLAEQGLIGLDDKLSKYLPSFPNGSKITVRMLMNHTSGIRDIFDPAIFRQIAAKPATRWKPDQVLALVSRPYFAPGAGYHYSNTNYIVLGQVIEKATGKSVASLVRTEFLTPLGLSHTYLQWQETPKGTLAHGYVGRTVAPRDISNGQALIPYVSEATAVGAAGAVVSNARDIAIWGTALYDAAFMNQATMASLLDVTTTARFKPQLLYGLGVEELPIAGRVAWGHRGHLDGFWSAVAYFPDSRVTVALLTNADWPNPLTGIASMIGTLPKPGA